MANNKAIIMAASGNMISGQAAVAPQVLTMLQHRIISGELPPGTRLSEQDIATGYGVSRQPVREAFIRLSDAGLVEIRPQRGTYVARISTATVVDAQFLREAVEAEIVQALAGQIDSDGIRQLRDLLAKQRQAMNDPSRFMELDDLFHATLAVLAGRRFAWTMLAACKVPMDRVRHLSRERIATSKLVAQHTAIVDAVGNRNATAAASAMRGHLREILLDLPVLAKDRPEWFVGD